jgi:chromosome segregation ATPase
VFELEEMERELAEARDRISELCGADNYMLATQVDRLRAERDEALNNYRTLIDSARKIERELADARKRLADRERREIEEMKVRKEG